MKFLQAKCCEIACAVRRQPGVANTTDDIETAVGTPRGKDAEQ
jgi:hypothetical protein